MLCYKKLQFTNLFSIFFFLNRDFYKINKIYKILYFGNLANLLILQKSWFRQLSTFFITFIITIIRPRHLRNSIIYLTQLPQVLHNLRYTITLAITLTTRITIHRYIARRLRTSCRRNFGFWFSYSKCLCFVDAKVLYADQKCKVGKW